MKLIAQIFIGAFALLLVAEFVPGISVESFTVALVASLVLGVLNVFVKPILVFFTLPITILTLGLFMFVINAGLFLLASSFVDGFVVSGFWSAILGSVIVSIANALGGKLLD